tara:strand:+ start:28310 stop:28672 length:363 start_codon:yes stop_codon:yes gene_type:complete
MDKKNKLINWVKLTLGYPIIDFGSDEMYETYMDMAEEDLEMLISECNIRTLPENMKDFLLAMLVKANIKIAYYRIIHQFGDNPKIKLFDWETFYTEGKAERQLIYDLMPKLDIYYKNEQW